MSHRDVIPLSIPALFDGHARYRVPIYQRNYAWGQAEIGQLIEDIRHLPEDTHRYHLGTLVVKEGKDERGTQYDVIDGQQRLTTLALILACVRHRKDPKRPLAHFKEIPLTFECRPRSGPTFTWIFAGANPAEESASHPAIKAGYDLVWKSLDGIQDGDDWDRFCERLLERVQIVRVCVPEGTDVNHYFEVMNSRGEQLELHEVLKSRMMNVLKSARERTCFRMVWDACANMDGYLEQSFTPEQRTALFGTGEESILEAEDFSRLCDLLLPEGAKMDSVPTDGGFSMEEILGKPSPGLSSWMTAGEAQARAQREDLQRSLSGVINFQNFLLHVLRVKERKDVSLDDKKLLEEFGLRIFGKKARGDQELPEDLSDEAKKTRVREFLFALLKCRFLLDRYVLKREYQGNDSSWSLMRAKRYKDGKLDYVNTFGKAGSGDGNDEPVHRQILWLLSAFHTVWPTQDYKHWLTAVLQHLYSAESAELTGPAYLKKLEEIARTFVFGNFLRAGEGASYFEMIFGSAPLSKPGSELEDGLLTYRGHRHRFVFNYLDYLLLTKHHGSPAFAQFHPRDWKFSQRLSVEHHYPQSGLKLSGAKLSDEETLHCFGNLCLVSDSQNSTLSNHDPDQKKEAYPNHTADSVKQYLMLYCLKLDGTRWDKWDAVSIAAHHEEMKAVLLSGLDDDEPVEA